MVRRADIRPIHTYSRTGFAFGVSLALGAHNVFIEPDAKLLHINFIKQPIVLIWSQSERKRAGASTMLAPPRHVLDLVQQTGRSARRGLMCPQPAAITASVCRPLLSVHVST